MSLIMGLSTSPITLRAHKMLGISLGGYDPTFDISFLLLFCWFIVIQMFFLIAIELIMPFGHLLNP
ncbi:hypothetical protein CIK61_17595 [Brevibacterium aurantiacum]|uniref:hypothetical protein n=1 Tax=Brevibacterium aurantiacum TaxID=273384 RepID=UPI000DF3F366|nr:hypothetical protein [Brevibacterium aurantiacum]RCS91861.1 hypothetical protein CIK61_17595 [Brevibacterium aurantiacum]